MFYRQTLPFATGKGARYADELMTHNYISMIALWHQPMLARPGGNRLPHARSSGGCSADAGQYRPEGGEVEVG